MARPSSLPVVGVVTVVRPEHDATLRAFGMTDANRVAGGGGLHFESTYQTRLSGPVRLVLSSMGEAGNDTSASLATELIGRFKPKFMLLCGIAGGVRGKVKIGDVVVPRMIVDVTEKVAKDGGFLPRPDIIRPLSGVLQMNAAAQVEASDFHSRFDSLFPEPIKPPRGKTKEYKQFVADRPSVHEAAIVSDNSLLRNPAVLAEIATSIHEQSRAGEMESAGFVKACMRNHPTPWYVARGISDFADSLKNDLFHKLASASVAAFAAAFVAHVLDLRIWDAVRDPAEEVNRNRWSVQTGDHLIDDALRGLQAYDHANAPNPEAIRKTIRRMLDSRSALNPSVYYEETAAFLFVVCWAKRMIMAYRAELSTSPGSEDAISEIITKLHKVEVEAARAYGPQFLLTTWLEKYLGDKDEFVGRLNRKAKRPMMNRRDLALRNELIPELRKLMGKAGLVTP
jgi:nucleoside phosphorylase